MHADRDHVDHVLEQWAAERPDLDTSPVAIIARLGRAARFTDQQMEQVLAQFGLSRESWDVLASLRRVGAPYRLSPTELYRSLMRTSGAITNRLARLEEGQLVGRVPDPDDRRSILVELTAKGRRLVDKVAPVHLENERQMLQSLRASDQKELARLLRQLVLAFESRGEPGAGGPS